jgi:plastocyanin
VRRLPWFVCAVLLAAAVPALAAGRAPVDAAFSVHDNYFQDAATPGSDDHAVTITTGGKVSFAFLAGSAPHNVAFNGAQPATCRQTAGTDPDPDDQAPLPNYPQSAGWAGECTFSAPGTYSFFCTAHGGMEGTVEVSGAGTPTPTPDPTSSPTPTPTATATATAPPPANALPAPTPVATPAATAVPAASKISAATFKRSKRTLSIAGTTTATGKVTIKLAYRVGKKARVKTFSATIKGGKFSGTLKLSSSDAKKASKLSVTVTAVGAPAATKTVSIRR